MNASPRRFDPSQSDGCTMFPDGRWLGCCIEHDRAYFYGGSWQEKRIADAILRRCVSAHGHPLIAWIMWAGVSLFGWRFWPWGPDWGYGLGTGGGDHE